MLLPDDWQSTGDGEVLATVFKPDGVGMLTFFLMPPDAKSGLPDAGKDFHGKMQSKQFDDTGSGAYHRSWYFPCRGGLHSVRYRCARKNSNLEDLEVDQILQSLEEIDE